MFYIYYNGSFFYPSEDRHYKHGAPQTKDWYATRKEAQNAIKELEFDLIKSKVKHIPNASKFIIDRDKVTVFFDGVHSKEYEKSFFLERS
jgi:hypothetical protein